MFVRKAGRLVACVALLTVMLSACEREGPAERAGEEIDRTAEQAGEAMEKAGERAGEAMEEAGEKMQDAAE